MKPIDALNDMDVHVGARKTGETDAVFADGDFTADAQGVWQGDIVLNGVTPGSDYFLYVKGPKHIQKKICSANPAETYVGSYSCGDIGTVKLQKGDNAIDLSHIALLSGDLPEQDGLANSYDLSTVRNLLGSTDAESLRQADVNLDGIVDTQDYSLILNSLAFRFDERPE